MRRYRRGSGETVTRNSEHESRIKNKKNVQLTILDLFFFAFDFRPVTFDPLFLCVLCVSVAFFLKFANWQSQITWLHYSIFIQIGDDHAICPFVCLTRI